MKSGSDFDSVWSALREMVSVLYGLVVTYALFIAGIYQSGGWWRVVAVVVAIATLLLIVACVIAFSVMLDKAWLPVRQAKAILLRKDSPVGSASVEYAGQRVQVGVIVEVTGFNLLFGLPEGRAWVEVPVEVYQYLALGKYYRVDYTRTRWGGEIKVIQIYA